MKAIAKLSMGILFLVAILGVAIGISNVYAAGADYNGEIVFPANASNISIQKTSDSWGRGTSNLFWVEINATIDENLSVVSAGQGNVNLTWYNSTCRTGCNYTMTNYTVDASGDVNATINITGLTNGTYNFTVFWQNISGSNLINNTLTKTIFVDTVAPNYTVNSLVANFTNQTTWQWLVNITVDPTYSYLHNASIEFANESAKTNYSMTCQYTTMSGTGDAIKKYYCFKTLNASETDHLYYFNYSIYVQDAAGNVNRSGLYFFRVDNTTPVIGSQVINQTFTNKSSNIEILGMYENSMFARFNVTDNSTENQPCWLQVWVQNVTTAGVRTWTLNTTTKLFGTYSADSSSGRNCTLLVNGTDIKNVLFGTGQTNDYGVVRLQAAANDSSGHTGYGLNFTVVYQKLNAGWNPVGWLGNAYTLGAVRGLLNNNVSYVSTRVNDFQNSSWVTYQYPINGNNATTINNHNNSGLYLYMDNEWLWIRANTTVTAIDRVWYSTQPTGINLTWSGATQSGWFWAKKDSFQCIGTNLSYPVNTSAALTGYINFTTAMVNNNIDANGSWGDPLNMSTLVGGDNVTYNSTCFNVTTNASKLTNIIYYTNNTKSSWNMFVVKNTNTTNYTAQELNATQIAWLNVSDTRCVGGCMVVFDKDMPYINNDTILYEGQAIWVLPDTTAWGRTAIVRVMSLNNPGMNNTNVFGIDIGENKAVKIWTRPQSLD